MKKELILKHATILFTELEDKGFGKNITIDVTDDSIRKTLEDWANESGITLKMRDYTKKDGTVTKQCQIKLSKFITIGGKDDQYDEKNLGFGALVNLILVSYEYDNKFGKGKTACVSTIYIVEPKHNTKLDSISE